MSVRTVALACFRKSYFFLRYSGWFIATPIERVPPPHEPLPLVAIYESVFGSYFSRTILSTSVHCAYRRSRSGESVLTETETARGRCVRSNVCAEHAKRDTYASNHFPLEYCMSFFRLSRVQRIVQVFVGPA